MFAYLEGKIADKQLDALTLDVGGVGFIINTNTATLQRAAGHEGRFKVYTRLLIREDAWDIYGFSTREEKEMFDKLTSVSGIGAKTALAVLSTLSIHDLALAVVTGDVKALKAVPGIGLKSAQRLMLELKDKVSNDELIGDYADFTVSSTPVQTGPAQDAMEALLALGYGQSEAAQALHGVKDKAHSAQELIRLALRAMSKL